MLRARSCDASAGLCPHLCLLAQRICLLQRLPDTLLRPQLLLLQAARHLRVRRTCLQQLLLRRCGDARCGVDLSKRPASPVQASESRGACLHKPSRVAMM